MNSPATPLRRNDPCACGSGKKYKHCCLAQQAAQHAAQMKEIEALEKITAPWLQQALSHHQAGRLPQAEALYQQILQRVPNHPDALHLLGVIATQCGQYARAVALIEQAIQIYPGSRLYYNLGVAHHALGDLAAAAASYRHALALQPDYVEAHCNLGVVLRAQGDLSAAAASLRSALGYRNDYLEAWSNLGLTLQEQGKLDEAIAVYQQALSLPNRSPDAGSGAQPDSMAAGAVKEAAVDPSAVLLSRIHYNLGLALHTQGQRAEAVVHYRQALCLRPEMPEVHSNLGAVLREMGDIQAAIQSYQQAIAAQPEFAVAHSNLGLALQECGALDAAIASCRKALQCQPDYVEAHSNLLFCLNYHPELSAEEIYQEYCQWNRQHAQRLPLTEQHHNPVEPNRRLKIGYVSPDLRQHSTQHFIEPLIVHHDKSQVELYAYAQVAVEDNVSSRLKHHIDHWCNTTGLSDAQLADQIRHDQIDILIDLAGHTRGNRLLTFARKPAPIQATCFGYGYTTGLDRIDYFLADAHYAPQGCESLFAEQIYRLPVAAAYRPASGMGAVNALPAASHGTITFASLSRLVRINARVIHTWAQILKRIPYARLIINSGDLRCADMQQRLQQQFAAHGIPPERLNLGFQSPPWDLLRTIDISLDCFPHNSGTTLYESLYLGVPFITLAARPSVGRIGASILHAVGRPEWIATSESDYIDKAVALASDLPQLARTRAVLRQQMQASRLMDEEGFTRSLEQAYRTLWARWCAQQQDAQNNPHHNPQIKNQLVVDLDVVKKQAPLIEGHA